MMVMEENGRSTEKVKQQAGRWIVMETRRGEGGWVEKVNSI